MQYPQRDIDRLITSLENIRENSSIADEYLKTQEAEHKAMRKAFSMGRLALSATDRSAEEFKQAKELDGLVDEELHVPHSFLILKARQLAAVMQEAETDLQQRKARIKAKKYGFRPVDL